MAEHQPLVVGIGGSVGPSSMTTGLLADCLDSAAALGARTELFAADLLALSCCMTPLVRIWTDAP